MDRAARRFEAIMKVNETEANDAEGMTEQPQLRRGGLINRCRGPNTEFIFGAGILKQIGHSVAVALYLYYT
jgi:hypothetical protein